MESPLLPSQLVGPKPDAFLPEKRLMIAVLAFALADYQKDAAATDVWGKRRFAEAKRWFASNDTRWPCSFANICEALGLDVSATRAGVRASRGRASAGPGFFWRD